MIEKVNSTIKKYNLITMEDKILVAVSGGPDSIALLDILHKLNYNIIVAHVNHGLRENAINDEEFVLDFCQNINVPCFVKELNLKENLNGQTLEEAGRSERYKFFNEVLKSQGCTKIATAHNKNDNAETVFMNMIRGTGMAGLTGIEIKRENIVRPLLEISRKDIEEYCEQNNLHPRHDESNDETLFTRNKIRLELIPYIEKNINSNVINNINRMSQIIMEDEKYILSEVDKAEKECIVKELDGKLVCNLKVFNKLEVAIRKRLIIKFIIKVLGNAKDIEKVHIEDILKLCENNVGKKFLMPKKSLKVSVDKNKVEYAKVDA